MDVSRRGFLKLSVAAAGGTALGGLVGSGVNLGPTVARAQELRIKDAKVRLIFDERAQWFDPAR